MDLKPYNGEYREMKDKSKANPIFTNLKTIVILTCLILLGICNFAKAQELRFNFAQYTDGKGDTLNYRILYPDYDTLRTYPLVIFLHGSGERGHDNKSQLKWGVLNFATDRNMMAYPAIIIAPQCPDSMHWSNFSGFNQDRQLHLLPEPSEPMRLVIGLVHQLMKKAPVDSTRIYITGLSMGGLGTYDAIERWPNLFAAAIPVAGGGDPTLAARIAHIPIWDFHGAEDPAVNPKYSREMINAILKAGGHPGYTVYPGVGHYAWLGAYSNPRVIAWLFRQHK